MKGSGKPGLYDIKTLIAAGINPKTGEPLRSGDGPCALKEGVKKALRLIDEQEAVNRYQWYNLPCNITSQELERMIYNNGQLCFFYIKELDQFYFMRYALDGTIDFYGRFNSIHPIPLTSGSTEDEKKATKTQADYLSTKKLDCVYAPIVYADQITEKLLHNSAVLLHDYTKQLSQTIISRQLINDPLIDIAAECVPLMRTSLIASSGTRGVRVNDADQQESVKDGSKALYEAALTGQPWVPIVGNLEFQELTDGNTLKAQEFMLAMQSLNNLRLSTYGLDNGGMFEKKGTILESENAVNQANVGLVLQDGLSIRQNFCNIVNSIWNLGIWCDISENLLGADTDGDGLSYDENTEGENSGSDSNEGVEDGSDN